MMMMMIWISSDDDDDDDDDYDDGDGDDDDDCLADLTDGGVDDRWLSNGRQWCVFPNSGHDISRCR
jgi:hypothetical protein